MAKISIILPDGLDKEVREYGKKEDLNLTNSCIILLKKGLESEDKEIIDSDKYGKIQNEMKELQKEYKQLKEKYETEREERLKVLDDYKNFNTKLLDLMQADRVLQLEQKQPKKNILNRLKIFFLGEKGE
jgi:hypothetical protein